MTLLQQFVSALYPILGLLLTLAGLWLASKLTTRLGAGAALDAAQELVLVTEQAVRHVGQTMKPQLLEAAGGKLTPEAGRTLLAAAVAGSKEALSVAASQLIASNEERLTKALTIAVEAAVAKQKATPTPVVVSSTTADQGSTLHGRVPQ